MDFTKLFQEAQERQPVYCTKLTPGLYYRCEKLTSGINTFDQKVVIAHLKNGCKIFLPKRLSEKLMPHCHELKAQDNWSLKLVRYDEEEMIFGGVKKHTKTPILEIKKGVAKDGAPDDALDGFSGGDESSGQRDVVEPLPGPSSSNSSSMPPPVPLKRKREAPTSKQRREKVQKLLFKFHNKQMEQESQIEFISDSDGDETFIPELEAELFEEDIFTQKKK